MNRFDKNFKEEAVRLVQEGGQNVSDVAKGLGIQANTLYKWIKQYNRHKENAFPGSGHLLQEDNEVRRLKKIVAELQEENAILKKATAIFAQHHKQEGSKKSR